MISEKLLGEILDKRFKYYDITQDGNNIRYMYDYNDVGTHEANINIYELAHKCKEWALKKHGKELFSQTKKHWQTTGKFYKGKSEIEITGYSGICIVNLSICSDIADQATYQKSRFEKVIKADTEAEVIFKACEWVLNETNTSKS